VHEIPSGRTFLGAMVFAKKGFGGGGAFFAFGFLRRLLEVSRGTVSEKKFFFEAFTSGKKGFEGVKGGEGSLLVGSWTVTSGKNGFEGVKGGDGSLLVGSWTVTSGKKGFEGVKGGEGSLLVGNWTVTLVSHDDIEGSGQGNFNGLKVRQERRPNLES